MKNWIVEVFVESQAILTIGFDFQSGKASLTIEDEEQIREAAESLLAFVGKPPNTPLQIDATEVHHRETCEKRMFGGSCTCGADNPHD